MSTFTKALFPTKRMRRNRRSAALRRLTAETGLGASDLIYPMFVLDGERRSETVKSMPGIFRHSIDGLLKEAEEAASLGIPAIALFPVVDAGQKSANGEECANPDGLVQRTVRTLKSLSSRSASSDFHALSRVS